MYKYLIVIIFFYACDDPTSSEIPPIYGDGDSVYSYTLSLASPNSGDYIDYATITWNQYHNYSEDFISYTIRDDNETIIELEDILLESYDVGINPETFYTVYLDVQTNANIYTDSIQIFTRSVDPITNLTAVADSESWFTSLNWNSSNETESNFSYYNIYRAFEQHNSFNDLETCGCLLDTLQNQNITSYIDSVGLTWGGGYYYLIETVTNQNDKRKSIIQSNILNPSYNPQIDDENTYASNSEYNKIIINWNHNLNEQQFYELEIWRSESETVDPLSQTKLATITDYNKNNFEDYYLIGDGVSWFYKINLIDIYGNSNTSNMIIGNSHP